MFERYYQDWNYKRIKKIIDHFGHNSFSGKTILDIGCGISDISAAFARLGANVTAVEARANHVDIGKRKYPHIKFIQADLDKTWQFFDTKFDYVFALGIICHVSKYQELLEKVCRAGDNIIIESEVCDSLDSNRIVQTSENSSIYDAAVNGVGYKPSSTNVENILSRCGFSFKRFDESGLNTKEFKYDWICKNSENRIIANRRFWIGKREHEIIVPKFITIPRSPLISQQVTLEPYRKTIKLEITPEDKASFSISNSNRIRIAVCLSGYLRSFALTSPSLKNNLPADTQIDYFIHTWDRLGAPLRDFDAKLSGMSTQQSLNEIKEFYNLREIQIEPRRQFAQNPLLVQANYRERRDMNGVQSMFYSMRQANELKSNFEKLYDFKYDVVVRARGDLMFGSKIPITICKPNLVCIPYGSDYGGLNDQLAWGSSETMDKYSNMFNSILTIVQEGYPFNPEIFCLKHLANNNISIERPNCNYYIKRG